jgi:hypothetical protein
VPEDLTCQGCGRPLAVRSGQTFILPSVTMTFDGDRLVDERVSDDCWCGDCVDAWNEAMNDDR